MGRQDDELFAALARAALARVSELNAQQLANTAWAFAKAGQSDDKLFAAWARVAEWQVSEFNSQQLANTAWAFANAWAKA